MSKLTFIDTNILMYAVGTEHPLKKPCLEIICKISKGDITAVTDTEVFQEVAYRYWSQHKWPKAVAVLNDYQSLFTEILPIDKDILAIYYSLLTEHSFLSPRDAIHIAVMKSEKISQVYTADKAFAKIPFLKVLPLS
jgi:predicted nucleic acid-binding protein